MKKGTFRHTEEANKKMSDMAKGKHHSPSTEFKKGCKSPSFWKGRKMSEEHIKKLSDSRRGRVCSEETRRKLSESQKGEKGYWWKGGVNPADKTFRKSLEYRLWREAVFTRDNWTCVWCSQRGGRLEADHIKRFSDHPALRLAIDNGRTLCISCHKKTDNYGRKGTKK